MFRRLDSPIIRRKHRILLISFQKRRDGRLVVLVNKMDGDQAKHPLPKPEPNGVGGIRDTLSRRDICGLSIAVIRDFKIHWVKAYGTADVDSGRPVQTNTPFQAASISKPVTAMAAMRLVDERRFSLDDDINTILKSWHAPGRSLTPRSLMSHTSGADDGETRGGNPGTLASFPIRRRNRAEPWTSMQPRKPGTMTPHADRCAKTGYDLNEASRSAPCAPTRGRHPEFRSRSRCFGATKDRWA
jgi:hypothetical protein